MCSFGSVEHYSMNVLSVLNLLPCIIKDSRHSFVPSLVTTVGLR